MRLSVSGRVDIGAAAQLACLLEAFAPKPGNVSPGAGFGDTSYLDFLASAAAIGRSLGSASRPLGEIILMAVRDTRRWVGVNTNLGIVLLLGPIARAAALCPPPDDAPIELDELDRHVIGWGAEGSCAGERSEEEDDPEVGVDADPASGVPNGHENELAARARGRA